MEGCSELRECKWRKEQLNAIIPAGDYTQDFIAKYFEEGEVVLKIPLYYREARKVIWRLLLDPTAKYEDPTGLKSSINYLVFPLTKGGKVSTVINILAEKSIDERLKRAKFECVKFEDELGDDDLQDVKECK